MSSCAILDGDDPDIGIERNLTRQIRIGVGFGSGVVGETGLPAALFTRLAEPAKRVLVRARKGSRAPLVLLRGLDLHDSSGAKYTPEVDEILHGTAEIAWS